MKAYAIYRDCNGEAHDNPNIDNCMVCLPFWGRYPVCPTDGGKLAESGFCKRCRKFADVVDYEHEYAMIDQNGVPEGWLGNAGALIDKVVQIKKTREALDIHLQIAREEAEHSLELQHQAEYADYVQNRSE